MLSSKIEGQTSFHTILSLFYLKLKSLICFSSSSSDCVFFIISKWFNGKFLQYYLFVPLVLFVLSIHCRIWWKNMSDRSVGCPWEKWSCWPHTWSVCVCLAARACAPQPLHQQPWCSSNPWRLQLCMHSHSNQACTPNNHSSQRWDITLLYKTCTLICSRATHHHSTRANF